MKNRIYRHGLSGLYKAAAVIALSSQLSTVSILPVNAQTASQPMFNESLPLPELNIGQLEKAVKVLRAKKTTAPTTAATPAAPKNINAGTLLAGSAPQDAGRLSASDDWIEDSLIMRQQAKANATKPNAAKPVAAAPAAATKTTPAPAAAVKPAVITPAEAPATAGNTTAISAPKPIAAAPVLRAPMSEKPVAPTKPAAETTATAVAPPATDTAVEAKPAQTPAASTATTPATTNVAETETPTPPVATDTTDTDNAKAAAETPKDTANNTALETGADNTGAAPDAMATESIGQDSAPQEPGKPVAMLTPELAASTPLDGVIIIDNDEAQEQAVTIEFEELPTDTSGGKVVAGARFPIVITSEITSKTAKVGDPVHARLKYDLKIKDRLVAEKGSVVRGHVNYALKARTPLASMVSPQRWYKDSGCLGIAFDEVINSKNEHIKLVAEPAKQAMFMKNKAEGRELGINHKGQIAGQWSQQLKYKAVRVGLNFALAPAGVFSFGAMPVALGVIGAANPSFAFMKPVGTNVRHRRIKGFFWGALSGVPGSWLIEDTTIKGNEAIIKPGDEFLAEMRKEFTGEPVTEAEVAANTDMQVQAELIKGGKKKRKKDK